MKIVFLTPTFPPYVGGISMRASRIATGLSQRGHEVIVYTGTHPQAPRVERIDGMIVKRHSLPFRIRFNKAPHTIRGIFEILGIKEIQEVNIVQSFHHMSLASLAGASLKLFRKKVFTLLPVLWPYSYGGRLMTSYRLTLGTYVIRYADFLMPETNLEKLNLIRLGVPNRRIKVIPSAVNSDAYKQLPDPAIFRRTYNIKTDEKIILFVGIPSFVKGLHHLILSMHNVLKTMPKARLVIVGPKKPITDALLRDFGSPDVRDRSVITGQLVGKSLISAYSAADVFVLPSIAEGFGTVILEAAASGLPLVCTKTGVAPDIIVEGKNGLFVNFGKVNQISNAIIKVLTDGNFKREAQKRRNLILKMYDHKKEVDQFEKVYLKLVC